MKKLIYIAAGAALLTGCAGGEEGWSVQGSAPGASKVYLEAPTKTFGWYVVDSVAADGSYKFLQPRAPQGSIFRLRAGGATAYIPVDSTETLTLNINPDGTYTLSGSEQADLMGAVTSRINQGGDDMIRDLTQLLSGHFDSSAAYYVARSGELNPRTSRDGLKLLRAVVNTFKNFRPDDPRTPALLADYQELQRRMVAASGITPSAVEIEAPITTYFDITLPDVAGKDRKLSEAVDHNHVVVLAYMDFSADETPAINVRLADLYSRFHSQGLEIYEIGFDANRYGWANVAQNLPWINVFQSESASRNHIGQYAVSELPSIFILVNGEIVSRPATLQEAVDIVTKQF